MAFEQIERLKLEYTDKYVIVAQPRPELRRFTGHVGQVKTINMSGRALVEFTGYLNNPAWHDIDLAALKVVDKPPEPEPPAKKKPKPASKVPSKPSGKSAADVLASVRGGALKKGAGKADAAGRTPKKKTSPSVGKSTADILAAARGGKPADPPPNEAAGDAKPVGKRTSPATKLSTADVLAAARGKAPAPAKKPVAKKAPSGMTTEEILAAARAAKKPAEDATPKTDAAADTADGAAGPEPRRKLSAADIRDIGLGKLSVRREQPIATAPLEKADLKPAETPATEALPEKLNHTKLTAADILKLGGRK